MTEPDPVEGARKRYRELLTKAENADDAAERIRLYEQLNIAWVELQRLRKDPKPQRQEAKRWWER